MSLRSAASAAIRFASQLLSAHAVGAVQVSVDGVTWQTVAVVTPAETWSHIVIDLNVFTGRVIQIRFVLESSMPEHSDAAERWLLERIQISISGV